MRLDDFVDIEANERAERRRLAKEKSYEILDHVESVADRVERTVSGDAVVGSVSPSIFVGRSNYPEVSTGILSPVGNESEADSYVTSGAWYDEGVDLTEVFRRRTSLLNSRRSASVDVSETWDGFVGVGREVAIADRPVDVEIGLDGDPRIDFDADGASPPTGPSAPARSATLGENPHVPRAVEKTLEDDDWRAEGAINYLYRRGFDVYDVNTILSAGALGRGENRRLVPTRWSITAVDDTIGQYLRGTVRNAPTIGQTSVWHAEYMGNEYWVVAAPGEWEFELLELKAPGSIWNPDPNGRLYMAADSEGYEGRTEYVDETSGAYYAARLGVLEALAERDRQATVFVIRHATEGYWAPVGVWQIRESIRDAVAGEAAVAESFHGAIRELVPRLPVSMADLRRKSTLAAGIQSDLSAFGGGAGSR